MKNKQLFSQVLRDKIRHLGNWGTTWLPSIRNICGHLLRECWSPGEFEDCYADDGPSLSPLSLSNHLFLDYKSKEEVRRLGSWPISSWSRPSMLKALSVSLLPLGYLCAEGHRVRIYEKLVKRQEDKYIYIFFSLLYKGLFISPSITELRYLTRKKHQQCPLPAKCLTFKYPLDCLPPVSSCWGSSSGGSFHLSHHKDHKSHRHHHQASWRL